MNAAGGAASVKAEAKDTDASTVPQVELDRGSIR